MSQTLIGVAGEKRHGKDTAAQALVEREGFLQVRFADALKGMLYTFYVYAGLDDEEEIERRIDGDLKEVPDPYLNGKTPRYAMQTLGTEWGRNLISDSIWVDTTKRCIDSFDGAPVVISDVRFPNEVEAVRAWGGKILKVVDPALLQNEFSAHPSETYIREIVGDATVVNLKEGIEPFADDVAKAVQAVLQSDVGGV